MHRLLQSCILTFFILCPTIIFGGTAQKANKTILLDHLPPQFSVKIEMVARFEIDYGHDPETTLGLQPGGNETNRLAPNAFEVDQNGSITIHDPVHKKVFKLEKTRSGYQSLKVVAPYVYDSVAKIKSRNRDFGRVKVESTGADTADIVFQNGESTRIVRLKIDGPLASTKIAGINGMGDLFMVIERFKKLGSLEVEKEILVLDSEGVPKTRLKLDTKAFAPPIVEFVLAPDGSLYRMIPGEESVTFVRFEVR